MLYYQDMGKHNMMLRRLNIYRYYNMMNIILLYHGATSRSKNVLCASLSIMLCSYPIVMYFYAGDIIIHPIVHSFVRSFFPSFYYLNGNTVCFCGHFDLQCYDSALSDGIPLWFQVQSVERGEEYRGPYKGWPVWQEGEFDWVQTLGVVRLKLLRHKLWFLGCRRRCRRSR